MYLTNKTGTIGELAAIQEFIKQDFDVYMPLSGKEECDFIACKDTKLFRVQVKSTSIVDRYGSFTVQLKRVRYNSTIHKIHKFDTRTCDILAVYIEPLQKVCFLHSSEITATCTISFREHRISNQTNLIDDYVSLDRIVNIS